MTPDKSRDLILERHLDASPEAVWRCWTRADLLKRWFTPAPVETVEAMIEPRPGGRFHTVMKLPDGKLMGSDGCVLAAETARRLVFTDALGPGWRPNGSTFMTAIISMEPDSGGTAYRAMILHADAEAREKHEAMGFDSGWGQTTAQLGELAAGLGATEGANGPN